VPELTTQRLYLRRWQAGDRAPFAELNGDREVMRHFPAPLTRHASDELADRLEADIASRGWGLWALEERSTGAFIGFTGLAPTDFEASFTPAFEIGWRLRDQRGVRALRPRPPARRRRSPSTSSASRRSCRSPCSTTPARAP